MLAWWLIIAELGAARSRAVPVPKFLLGVTLERSRRWPCFLASALLHGIMLIALPVAGDWLEATRPQLWMHRYRLIASVEIRPPERLYLAATPLPRRKPTATPAKPGGKTAREIRPSPSRETALRVASGPRRRFELPRLAPQPTEQTLLQPDFPADLPVLGRINLPDLFIWSPLPNHPAFRIRKPFVTPGSAEPFAQPPAFDAPPQLTAPNWEAVASELQAASARASSPESLLLPAISLPIRLPELIVRPPHTYVSTERTVGDPLSVLALSLRPRPIREDLIIPPGNQLAQGDLGTGAGRDPSGDEAGRAGQAAQPPTPGARDEKGATGSPQLAESNSPASSAKAAQPNATGAAAAPTGQTAGRQADRQGLPESTATSPTGPSAPGVSGGTSSPAGAAPPGASPAVRTNPNQPAAEPAPAGAVVRIEHPPGAVADVVVVQPAPMDGTIETSGALSGRPVYSVFLHVGAARQWILQYCVPGEDQSTTVTGGVVRLGSPAPLNAPYPKVTYLPALRPRPGTYLLVHGYINAAGRFEALQALRAADRDEVAAIIPVLERWEFRPAMREGRPVRIEILLAIPRG